MPALDAFDRDGIRHEVSLIKRGEVWTGRYRAAEAGTESPEDGDAETPTLVVSVREVSTLRLYSVTVEGRPAPLDTWAASPEEAVARVQAGAGTGDPHGEPWEQFDEGD